MVAIGIVVALVAALANAFSIVLQAAEARHTPDREGMHLSLLRDLAQRPRWLLGTALMLVVWVLQVVALAFASIAIVQPTIASSQLALLAIARARLGERIGRIEVLATLALIVGLAAVIWSAHGEAGNHVVLGRIAAPMAIVGSLALAAYLGGRSHHRARLLLVLGAGVAYSWSDFVNKLLSTDASNGRWGLAAIWIGASVAIGALAFLEENTALQHRPTVTVAPVIAAVKVPLPVLMALWAGLASWAGGALHQAAMLGGLGVVAISAASLGRSQAVVRISCSEEQRERETAAAVGDGKPSDRPRGAVGHSQAPASDSGVGQSTHHASAQQKSAL